MPTDLDPWLPAVERRPDRDVDRADRGGVDRVEHEIVDRATELRAHRTLARSRAEDQPDRLLDVLFGTGQRDAAAMVNTEREGKPRAEDVRHVAPPIRA